MIFAYLSQHIFSKTKQNPKTEKLTMLEHVINIIYESGKGHINTIVVN